MASIWPDCRRRVHRGHLVEADHLDVLDVLGSPLVAGRAALGSDLLALKLGDVGDARIAAHGDALVHVAVRIGEIHLLQALVGDGERRHADVSLAAGLDERHDGVELGGRQILALETHLFRQQGHEVHREAFGLGRR